MKKGRGRLALKRLWLCLLGSRQIKRLEISAWKQGWLSPYLHHIWGIKKDSGSSSCICKCAEQIKKLIGSVSIIKSWIPDQNTSSWTVIHDFVQSDLCAYFTLPLSISLQGTTIFLAMASWRARWSIQIMAARQISVINTSIELKGGLENSEKPVLL